MRSPQASFQGLQRGTQRKGFQESSLSLRRSQSCTQASLARGQDIKHTTKNLFVVFFFFLINSAPAFFFFLIGSLNSVSVNCCDTTSMSSFSILQLKNCMLQSSVSV